MRSLHSTTSTVCTLVSEFLLYLFLWLAHMFMHIFEGGVHIMSLSHSFVTQYFEHIITTSRQYYPYVSDDVQESGYGSTRTKQLRLSQRQMRRWWRWRRPVVKMWSGCIIIRPHPTLTTSTTTSHTSPSHIRSSDPLLGGGGQGGLRTRRRKQQQQQQQQQSRLNQWDLQQIVQQVTTNVMQQLRKQSGEFITQPTNTTQRKQQPQFQQQQQRQRQRQQQQQTTTTPQRESQSETQSRQPGRQQRQQTLLRQPPAMQVTETEKLPWTSHAKPAQPEISYENAMLYLPVLTYDQVQERIAAQGKVESLIVILSADSQYDHLTQLVQSISVPPEISIFLVWAMHRPPPQQDSWKEEPALTTDRKWIPMRWKQLHGKLVTTILRSCSSTARPTTGKPATTSCLGSTVTLQLQIPLKYVDSQRAHLIQSNPRLAIQKACALIQLNPLRVWAVRHDAEQLSAHILVHDKGIDEVLQRSGEHAIFLKLWPMKPTTLEWCPRLPQESPRQHLERVLTLQRDHSHQGLVWAKRAGEEALAIRVPLADGATMPRTFILRPPLALDTDPSAITTMLDSTGWKSTQITKRIFVKGRQPRTMFVFHGAPPPETAQLFLNNEQAQARLDNQMYNDMPSELFIEPFKLRPRPRPTGQHLAVGAWSLTKNVTEEMSAFNASQSDLPAGDDVTMPDANPPSQAQGEGGKRPGETADSSQKKARTSTRKREKTVSDIATKLTYNQMKLHNVPGDGNCFFHSLAVGTELSSNHIRDRVAKWLSTNSRCKSYTQLAASTPEQWNKHIEELAKLGTYAESSSVLAAASLASQPVRVITPDHLYTFIPPGADAGNTNIVLYLEGLHYQRVLTSTGSSIQHKQLDNLNLKTTTIHIQQPQIVNLTGGGFTALPLPTASSTPAATTTTSSKVLPRDRRHLHQHRQLESMAAGSTNCPPSTPMNRNAHQHRQCTDTTRAPNTTIKTTFGTPVSTHRVTATTEH